MRIIRDTPEQLIVANRPWLIGSMLILFILVFVGAGFLVATGEEENLWFGVLFGGLGGGLGAIAFCVFVRRVQIIFDQSDDKITIRRQSVFGYSSDTHALADLTHVEVEETTSIQDGHRSTLYRATLVLDKSTSAGGGSETRIPIVAAYVGGPGAERLAQRINTWLPATNRI